MAKASAATAWQRALVLLTGTVVGGAVVAILYWAQPVLIPVALAAFLTFLLSPLVTGLQRLRIGRVPAVIVVVTLAAVLLAGLAWLVTRQLTSLVAELPKYEQTIRQKIRDLREMARGPASDEIERLIRGIRGELGMDAEGEEAAGVEEIADTVGTPEKPQKVVVQPDSPAWLSGLPLLSPVFEVLGSLALAIVLAVFMLLKREDLRNRLIRLIGHGRITVTTKAVDDAGKRISRFLLMQLIVNATYGLALSVGLMIIGVDYAFLWGFLAAVLRYVPYVGPWIAAVFPILLSLALFEGWGRPLAVLGLFLVLELVSNNVMEPLLYGQSIGVSEVALLVAAAFWTFLWGPIGLVLSAPLTVCLVVLGKYVPQLSFFDVILGDAPPLSRDVSYYQRLLAGDLDEAADIVEAYLRTAPRENVYDTLLVPGLTYLRRDREHEDLTEVDERFVLQGTREIVEDLGEQQPLPAAGEKAPARVRVLGCPARDEADRLALEMLQQVLDPARWEVEVMNAELLTAELLTTVEQKKPTVVLIGSLPPGGLAHTRYLCKRLRARFPAVKIVVGRWGLQGGLEENQTALRNAGADNVDTSILETRNQLTAWLPVLEKAAAEATPAA